MSIRRNGFVSEDALRKKLADFTLDLHAISGLRTDQLQGAAERAAASRPKQVIINLGTNGVLQGKSVEQMKADLDKIDWNKVVESNESAGKDAVTLDRIHPNAKGKLLLAEAYAKATRNCGKPIAT